MPFMSSASAKDILMVLILSSTTNRLPREGVNLVGRLRDLPCNVIIVLFVVDSYQ